MSECFDWNVWGSKVSRKTVPCPRSLYGETAVAVIRPGSWNSQSTRVHVRVAQGLKTRWKCMTNVLIQRYNWADNIVHTRYRSPGISTWPIQFQWFSSLTESLLFVFFVISQSNWFRQHSPYRKTTDRPENVNTIKKQRVSEIVYVIFLLRKLVHWISFIHQEEPVATKRTNKLN